VAVRTLALPTTARPTRTCKNGHVIEGYNAQEVRHTSGRMYTACRTCRRDAVERVRARQRGEDVTLLAPTPQVKPVPSFATTQVWKALPADLRRRVAGILTDPAPPDPLVAAVIRRAAQKRVWDELGVHFAVIALVDGLVEECRGARSTRLRLDRVLQTLFGYPPG
jgi:hypothetical protein